MPSEKSPSAASPLRILHVVRAPIGGIFRHVMDLAIAQAASGHAVGVVCDSSTGTSFEEGWIAQLEPHLALGIHRLPMARAGGFRDVRSARSVARLAKVLEPDVIHGHGAKGGTYARIAGTLLRFSGQRPARIYTPHGGVLHLPWSTGSRVYFAIERTLGRVTDHIAFVSRFEEEAYVDKIGRPKRSSAVVHNGLRAEEFEPVPLRPGARDFLFIGVLRALKGADLFLEGLAAAQQELGRKLTAYMIGPSNIGEGEGRPLLESLGTRLGLADSVSFRGPLPAREAFALARILVVPSRAESMPYIVLEAVAAAKPLLATPVGGIPEIIPPGDSALIAEPSAEAVARAMVDAIRAGEELESQARARAELIRGPFSIETMAAEIERGYRAALARRRRGRARPETAPTSA